MPISLIANSNNEQYTLIKKPGLLIVDGKEFYVTETGAMFPADAFTYVFNLDDINYRINRVVPSKLFDDVIG